MTASGIAMALVLAALDLAARTARIRWLLGTLGVSLRWWDALRLNSWADLAAALTPMRLGGEPARFAALRLFQVPMRPTVAGLALEVIVATPTTCLLGLAMFGFWGRSWLSTAAGGFGGGMALVLGASLILGAGLGWWWRRSHRLTEPSPTAIPRLTGVAVLLISLTTGASVLCRVAILPVLLGASEAGSGPGILLLESFVLLFGQALLPMPAGGGIVDTAFLHGAAGAAGVTTLLVWRACTTGLGMVLGSVFLVLRLVGSRLRPRTGSSRLGTLAPSGADDGGVVLEQSVQHRPPLPRHGGNPATFCQPTTEAPVGE